MSQQNNVYIIFPGFRVQGIEEWYNVKSLKQALLCKGISSNLICLDDYTDSEFSLLPDPAGVIIIHVLTHAIITNFSFKLKVISKWNSVFLNDYSAHDSVSNKLRMYHILKQNNISIPNTIGLNGYSHISDEYIGQIFNTLGSPLVIKPYRGFRGQHTALCYDKKDFIENLNIVRSNKKLQYEKIGIKSSLSVIQEYVKEYADMYIRIYATDTYMGGYLGLVSPFESAAFNNFNKHKFRVPYKIEPEVSILLRKTLSVLNINVAACDLLKDDNGYKIMDINAFGDFKTYDAVCKVNFVDKIVECFYNKLISQG